MHTLSYLSEELSDLRPFLRLRATILRPLFVAMRARNPCLLTFFLFEGWNVRFMCKTFLYVEIIIREIRTHNIITEYIYCQES